MTAKLSSPVAIVIAACLLVLSGCQNAGDGADRPSANNAASAGADGSGGRTGGDAGQADNSGGQTKSGDGSGESGGSGDTSGSGDNGGSGDTGDTSGKGDNDSGDNGSGGTPTAFKQSPMLDGKDLPPVEERLPENPKVVYEQPEKFLDYEIGRYGGTLRTVRTQVDVDNTVFIATDEPLVNTPGFLGEEVTPNIASYSVSADNKVFTFTLRKGLKWSDGTPATTADVKFAVEDVLFNAELTPGGVPAWLRSGNKPDGTPLKLDVVDDTTFKIAFDQPYGGFLMQLAWVGWRSYKDLLKPKHYLEQFHTAYTPLEQLESAIKKEGFNPGEWWNLFNKKDIVNGEISMPDAIGFPVLDPYIEVNNTGETIEWARNPYYFKVDQAGYQLPYIDRVTSTLVQDTQSVLLKVMAGEVDSSYEYVTLPQVPLLKENEQQGGYKVYLTELNRTGGDAMFNLTYKDDNWRKAVRDLRFRQAMNLGLNKQDIADTVYYGYAKPEPMQGAEYDPEKAKQLLDDMGMKLGSDGFRTGPDGKTFTIPIEYPNWMDTITDTAQLVAEQWRQLGFKVTLKADDLALWTKRNAANELQATINFNPGPVQWARTDGWGTNVWAPLWDLWYNSGGKDGEEPPQDVKDLYGLINSISQYLPDRAIRVQQEIEKNFGENLWFLIPVREITLPVAINAAIGNYTDKGMGIAQNFNAEAWFFKQ